MAKRIKLSDRVLPNYSKGEEIFNMVSHIVGGALGIVSLVLCVIFGAINHGFVGVISGVIYGGSLILLYCMSSIYHGMHTGTGKKVMQILDHCAIYFLIAGSYTPVLLISIRPTYPTIAWSLMAVVWGCALVACTLTAIDLKKYNVMSMICYLAMGWCIIVFIKQTYECVGFGGVAYLLAGGISYTIGSILYGLGKKIKWMHSVFHVFIFIGSLLQFFAIFFYSFL